MYSKRLRRLVSTYPLLIFFSCHVASVALADSVHLSVVPDRCVSLLKGQTCYQRVQFVWTSLDSANVHESICLWREGDSVALSCWEGQSEGVFRYNLEAAETTEFYLVAGVQQQPVIDRIMVTISWVYNNRAARSSRWRLF